MKYIYAVPRGNWEKQHLLLSFDGPAICGATSDGVWTIANPSLKPHPGVALCDDCKAARKANIETNKAEALRRRADAAKTFWLQEATR